MDENTCGSGADLYESSPRGTCMGFEVFRLASQTFVCVGSGDGDLSRF